MKRISIILLLSLALVMLTACGSNVADSSEQTTDNVVTTEGSASADDVVKIGINKDSLADPVAFVSSMEDYGAEVKDMTDAGGYILIFSKEEHKKLLNDKKSEALKTFKEYEENSEHYVDSIEFDDDFRNLKLYVDKDKYSSSATATSDIIVASAALAYQMFLEDGQKTVVEVMYSGTDEVISTFVLPMNLSYEQ